MRAVVPVLLVAIAAGLWFALEERPADSLSPSPAPAAAPEPTAPVGPTPVTAAAPERRAAVPAATPAEGYVVFPDGSSFPPLNGVKQAPKIVFHPKHMPFTKVIAIERDAQGRDWFVHDNGVRSTVYVNAQGVATYDVMKEMPPQPMVDDVPPPGGGR